MAFEFLTTKGRIVAVELRADPERIRALDVAIIAQHTTISAFYPANEANPESSAPAATRTADFRRVEKPGVSEGMGARASPSDRAGTREECRRNTASPVSAEVWVASAV